MITSVLTGLMGVVARGAAPPPPPSGGGAGGPGTLVGGQRLYADQQIVSADGTVALRYQSDGNLVLYGSSGVLWDAGTSGHSAGHAEMQTDGNVVIYDGAGTPVWATGTAAAGAYLRVHGEGYVMVHDAAGVGLWWSGSGAP